MKDYAALMRIKLRAEMQLEFTIENGKVHILDGVRVPRSSRGAVRIAVRLAEEGIISKAEALMRVEPRTLTELLHRQVSPNAKRDVLGRGIAASPGAATGAIVFTSNEAQASAARGEPCILVRRETSPEDIRGMHAAHAVSALIALGWVYTRLGRDPQQTMVEFTTIQLFWYFVVGVWPILYWQVYL